MAEFWALTPFELNAVFKACDAQQKTDLELAFYSAYYSGLFARYPVSKKFPKYDDVSPNRKPKKRRAGMGWKEQKTMAMALNAAFGGVVKKRGEQ